MAIKLNSNRIMFGIDLILKGTLDMRVSFGFLSFSSLEDRRESRVVVEIETEIRQIYGATEPFTCS